MSFLSTISGKDLITPIRVGNVKSKKKQLLTSIMNEMKLLKERANTNLLRIKKRINGEMKDVNESRFWRMNPSNPNTVYLTVKLRKKIWWFGEKEDKHQLPYIEIENNKESIYNELENIYNKLESEDESSNLFKTYSEIQKSKESVKQFLVNNL